MRLSSWFIYKITETRSMVAVIGIQNRTETRPGMGMKKKK